MRPDASLLLHPFHWVQQVMPCNQGTSAQTSACIACTTRPCYPKCMLERFKHIRPACWKTLYPSRYLGNDGFLLSIPGQSPAGTFRALCSNAGTCGKHMCPRAAALCPGRRSAPAWRWGPASAYLAKIPTHLLPHQATAHPASIPKPAAVLACRPMLACAAVDMC